MRSRCSQTPRYEPPSVRSEDVPALRVFLHGDGYTIGKEQRARRRERESQFTRALRLFRGSRRIFFEAGFALNIIVSLVKGLMP